MKIQVKRNGRSATQEELEAAVVGDPLPSTNPAIELLGAEQRKYVQRIKTLTSQLHGVERALEIAQAKLSAIEEAQAAISGK